MPFNPKSLRVVAYADKFTLWHYRSNDNKNNIAKENYFANATGIIHKGDIIIVENNNQSNNLEISIFAVTDENPNSVKTDSIAQQG